jgi:hypothetical protein
MQKIALKILKYLGILMMLYAIIGWVYWQFFSNQFSPNPKSLFAGLQMFTKEGIKYMTIQALYIGIGSIGYGVYQTSKDKLQIKQTQTKNNHALPHS